MFDFTLNVIRWQLVAKGGPNNSSPPHSYISLLALRGGAISHCLVSGLAMGGLRSVEYGEVTFKGLQVQTSRRLVGFVSSRFEHWEHCLSEPSCHVSWRGHMQNPGQQPQQIRGQRQLPAVCGRHLACATPTEPPDDPSNSQGRRTTQPSPANPQNRGR